jgi:DNA-binding CsgD family transcriptional regulator
MHDQLPTASLNQSVNMVQSGDHLCCLYSDRSVQAEISAAYLEEGFRRKEKSVFIADEDMNAQFRACLADRGIPVQALESKKQLLCLPYPQTYTRNNVFDPEAMIAFLKKLMAMGQEEGFRGLRITGDMAWALNNWTGSERLIEYEARLNDFFPHSRASGLCQYDLQRFDPDIILQVLETHPKVLLNGCLLDNFYYIPPEDYLSDTLGAVRIDTWLHNLQKHHQTNHELLALKDTLEHQVQARTQRLEEANTALKVLMEHRDSTKQQLAENVAAGVNTLLRPYMQRIQEMGLTPAQQDLMDVLERHVDELTRPLPMRLTDRYSGITPREIEVAAMIRNGKNSEEIALALMISKSAVAFHRQNLRRKLGLQGKKTTLRLILQELMTAD